MSIPKAEHPIFKEASDMLLRSVLDTVQQRSTAMEILMEPFCGGDIEDRDKMVDMAISTAVTKLFVGVLAHSVEKDKVVSTMSVVTALVQHHQETCRDLRRH